ncbi:6,7-dimethyl-8-ribityllumazine synthase [Pirellula staleyi DSM 6068]|uniref:6,7-dimethyl-8-ribityllumazine synthase n=1 Tax=Pirellula staleyi (strain ATCC 27377 / DSM 6068 / ICPB 4128) TaxID=530564 RepID=D2R702_PIRSD|nr:6,7-dimethyl-8-ribityllumazine synthase [Pirellula staleyi]ADB19205.1 6,7-dimethyl-8-ribityllumazine synthase [Pirellula staleyi DSM 6068]
MHKLLTGQTGDVAGDYAIVVSRYNDSITFKLRDAAISTLTAAGVSSFSITVCEVPGAWEIPLIAKKLAATKRYAAILTLGAVIKGETTHDEHINRQVSLSLGQLSLEFGIPILFGVLTTNTLEQAIHRAGGNVGNKGEECATAALEMVRLVRKL